MKPQNTISFLVLHNIQPVNGGATYAAMLRADALASISKKVIIFTYGFDFDYKGSVSYWEDKLENFNKIEFINLFEKDEVIRKDIEMTSMTEVHSKFPDNNNPYAFRIFENGVYKRYEGYSDGGYLKSIDHFESPWVRTSKSIFSKTGGHIVEHYMDKITNKIAFSSYFSSVGNPVYSCTYSKDTGKPSIFFDHILLKEFNDFNYLIAGQVSRLCSEYNNVVLFLEKREFIVPFSNVNTYKKIFVLHSNHLAYPYNDPNKVGESILPAFHNVDSIDKLVALTHRQRDHIADYLKDKSSKVVVINHAQKEVPPEQQQIEGFHNHTISSVARYHPHKNLVEAIKAFKLVTQILPDAIYNIYGYGPQENELKKLIEDLQLENNVFLKGFTTDVASVYRNSCLTILTSMCEGQPLVISESMAYGVPVISYDTFYGPEELIENDYNGYLVKKHDITELSSKILVVLLDESLRKRLSNNARKITERLSIDKFKENWIELLSE